VGGDGVDLARFLLGEYNDIDMVPNGIDFGEVNVVASQADWAWPEALRSIFRPRGVNLLVAQRPCEFMQIIGSKRIHTAIIDVDSDPSGPVGTLRLIRVGYPLLPCILLSRRVERSLLDKALEMDVFSVLDKPVDMGLLRRQLHRLFLKRYNSTIFGE